jgi:putative transposase
VQVLSGLTRRAWLGGGAGSTTETIEPVTTDAVLDEDQTQRLAQRLVDQAREQGFDLVGPGGVLTGLTKQVLEAALEEVFEHLGYDMHVPAGRNGRTPETAPGPRRC